MKRQKNSKLILKSVILKVPDIKDLYDNFIRVGFTTEQAYGLVVTILKLVIK
jgi:hypothetical protein